MSANIIVEEGFVDFPPDGGVYDLVENHAVAFALLGCAEDAAAEGRSVQGSARTGGIIGGGWEKEIRSAGAEVVDDCFVARCSWFDDLAGEEVGVDDGDGVGG